MKIGGDGDRPAVNRNIKTIYIITNGYKVAVVFTSSRGSLLRVVAINNATVLIQLVHVRTPHLVAAACVVVQPAVGVRNHIMTEGTAVAKLTLSRFLKE